MEKQITFRNSKAQSLAGILHLPENVKNAPAIILCHGFAGDKIGNYRLRVRLARELCKNGFAVMRFDFSCHGDSEGELEDISITQELDDLECAINFLKGMPEINKEKIGIVGHSLGGEIAILKSEEKKYIKALVLLAPVVDYRLMSRDFHESMEEAQKNGFAERSSHKIKKLYFDELRKFRPLDEIGKITAPVLVIHGDADDRVDIAGSKELVEKANAPKKLVVISGADHLFLGYEITMRLIRETCGWFSEHLK